MVLSLGITGATEAADVKVRVLGWNANQPQTQQLERPFWQSLETRSSGVLSADFRALDEVGLKGFESLRTLQSDAFDIVAIQVSFVSGDDPVLVGTDLPGLSDSFEKLRKINEAYRPIFDAALHSKYGGKLLAIWAFPPQILYCKDQISGLADLKGKKIRGTSVFTAKAVEYLGGVSATIAGSEVYQALLTGVVDCATTGSQFAAANAWHEVAKTLYPIPLGGNGVGLHVVREKFWNGLTAKQRETLTAQMKELEDGYWKMADETHENGVNCNIGRDPCVGAKKGSMKMLNITSTEHEKMNEILRAAVLPSWLASCVRIAPTCRDDWNRTVGQMVQIQIQ